VVTFLTPLDAKKRLNVLTFFNIPFIFFLFLFAPLKKEQTKIKRKNKKNRMQKKMTP
jgi:hypothetical protein